MATVLNHTAGSHISRIFGKIHRRREGKKKGRKEGKAKKGRKTARKKEKKKDRELLVALWYLEPKWLRYSNESPRRMSRSFLAGPSRDFLSLSCRERRKRVLFCAVAVAMSIRVASSSPFVSHRVASSSRISLCTSWQGEHGCREGWPERSDVH